VFNAEPARANGNVVTSRKGGAFMRLDVQGRAAHAGVNFTDGLSAVEELAHKVIALRTITDLARGVTLNVGTISGGQSVNTVAPSASATIDLRYGSQQDREDATSAIEAIVGNATIHGTTATLNIEGEFDAFCKSEISLDLFAAYQDALSNFGIKVEGEFTRGCADSGITSGMGVPTVCAVGPVGGKVHTADECMEVDTLVPRAQGLALVLARLGAQ
jgi:glutamate carboxypeptidase